MEEKRAEAKYKLTLGATVYIGSQEYSISSFDENTVLLYNPRCPLISEEMPRLEFDAKLRENPLNDGLIDDGKPDEEQPAPEAPLSDSVHVGDTIEHDGRSYVVESIGSISRDISMRDTTFAHENGFPISRVEKLETVEGWLEEKNTDLTPAWEKTKPEDMPIMPSPTGEKHDFRITDMELGYGGPKAKFRMNTNAIRLLKQLEAENRLATPDEQTILSKYVGWGALSAAFNENNEQWKSEYEELRGLLTPEEYAAARSSTLNAHYASPTVISAIYSALSSFGFKTGNVLEPACGIGNFFGMLPDEMRGSKLYGVELDPVTGRIARQLYQSANIAIQGFEETNLPDSFFDVVIGNVPFGDYSVPDKKYDKEHMLIHDYFIAKSLDKVRPGGIVAVVTSSGTLDKQNSSVPR